MAGGGAAGKRQAKAATKKKAKDIEESKEASHVEEEEDEELEDTEAGHEDDLVNKYGFRQQIDIELTLPTEEKEFIFGHELKFLDRNYQAKQYAELEGIKQEAMLDPEAGEKAPLKLEEASSDYECNLSDVIVYLKKCGYALENCFVSFWSPVFSAFINCGLDPLPQSIKLTKEDFQSPKGKEQKEQDGGNAYRLHLKFLWGIRSEYKGDDEGA
jgi:hypothetical protein